MLQVPCSYAQYKYKYTTVVDAVHPMVTFIIRTGLHAATANANCDECYNCHACSHAHQATATVMHMYCECGGLLHNHLC